MKNSVVRLESITIENFKNVTYGHLNLKNTRKNYASSILGLYGQNGSGKTALINAMELLKHALCGQNIPLRFADYVNVNTDFAKLTYEFKLTDRDHGGAYTVLYSVCLKKETDENTQNTNLPGAAERRRTAVFDETLSYAYESGEEKSRMTTVIDTRAAQILAAKSIVAFAPRSKYELLVGRDRSVTTDLLVAKKMAEISSRSFVFSRELLSAIRKNCTDRRVMFVIENLVYYGNFELFIISAVNTGLVSMNALPLAFQYEENNRKMIGNLMLPLNRPTTIPEEAVSMVERVIDNLNIVLSQIIPGMTIGMKELETTLLKNNKAGTKIQLISNKNGKGIPLQYESDGIKKIISVLQLLIIVYNQPSFTVAIDELDAGVFEYLLGEILRIVSEKGKGQLIFTSHNLRPLETLDRGFIAFTTTNPANRYIRFAHTRSNSNLRDFYYRDIVLGEQEECVYESTNNYEIALAFREAGELSGS